MADQKPKSDLKLRLRMLEKQMDNLVDRFDASNLLLLDLMARIGKIEVWCKQMQEDGRFVYDLEMQENASLDKKAEPTQVLGETMGKQDESVHEAAESKCRVVEEGDIIEFEKKMQEVSSAVESLEGLVEVNLLFQSLRSTEGASQEAEGIIQGAGISKDGSVNERKEFKDENREQEEVRELENPDESGETVEDLSATSVEKEHFGQGTEEMGDDCVKLDASKEFETRVSERIRLEEEVEDSKIEDKERGNDCELELLEVDGGNEERRLAEGVGKQEAAVRSEAEDEEGTEHGDISEPAKMEDCIGEAKLESSEEVEKSLSGERRKEEELVKSKAMDEENQEKNYELQLACIEECIEESSEQVERGLFEEAGREEEAAGSKIEVEEKIEHEYELVSMEIEGDIEEAVLDTSEKFERRLSERKGMQEEVVQNKVENEEQKEQNNKLQSADIQMYMEEAILDTSELERRHSEETGRKEDAPNKIEDAEENEHDYESEPAKMEAMFDTSEGLDRRLCGDGGKQKEMVLSKTEHEEEKPRDYKPDPAKMEECNEEARLGTSEPSDRLLSEEAEKQKVVVQSKPQDGEGKGHDSEIERAKVEECVDRREETERMHSGENGEQEGELQSKMEAGEETEHGYKSLPVKIDDDTEEARLDTLEQFEGRFSDEARKPEEALGSKIGEGEQNESDSELKTSEASLDTSKDSVIEFPEEDVIHNKIDETLKLITINIENITSIRKSHELRKSIGDCVRKIVDSSVMELNQKVHRLESELTEQNIVTCRLKGEIRRLYTELTKTAKKSNSLKEKIKLFQEKANTETLKQRAYQNYALDLAGKCYDVSVSAENAMMERRRKCLDYKNLKKKYEILKSKYKAVAKYGGECEETNHVDADTDQEEDKLADEAMEQEMASILECQRELKESFKKVFETPPLVQHFEVERVRNAEALNRCRMEVLEAIQKDPQTRLKAMEAMLKKRKKEHDYIWKGVINKLKLSLHDTVGEECPILTNLLLEYGVSRNAEDSKRNTPLHYAARSGNVAVGRALVEAGAHVNSQNSHKMTPLHVALYHKHIFFSLMLLRGQTDVTLMDVSKNTVLHLAALTGHIFIVNRLIDKEADVNAVDCEGDAPIFNAAIGGNVVIGEALVVAGADVSAINNKGSTPLHVAAWEGNIAFCIFLLSQGVPVDPINWHNVTPLHLAAMEDHGDIVQLLIARGATVNCLEDRTDSPLHYAAKFGNVSMTKALIRAGANVSAVNVEKRTPLHTAAAKGHSEVCVLLIKAGSDVNALDEKNRTPLHMVAMYGGTSPVAEVLVKKGANMAAVDSNGLTPCDLGYAFKNMEFAVWLEEQIFVRYGRREKGPVRKKGSRGKK